MTRRNLIVVALLAAVLLSAALISLWFALQNNQYRKDFTVYVDGIQQTLDASSDTFKKLHQDDDTAGTSRALSALADNVSDKAAHMPTAPSLFGVRFGTKSEVAQQQAIEERVKVYALNLKDAAVYIDYQQKAVAPLAELALKSADNAEQIAQLAEAWQQASDAHGQVQPPAVAMQAHELLGQKIDEIQTHIAQLGVLYAKVDIQGFASKQRELQASIASLKPIGEQFAGIAKEYDAALHTNLDALLGAMRDPVNMM